MKEGPPDRLMLIMDRHQAMLERKRLAGKKHVGDGATPTCIINAGIDIRDNPALEVKPKVQPQVQPEVKPPKPALAVSPLALPEGSRHHRNGSKGGKASRHVGPMPMHDYAAAIKTLGRPSQREIAAYLGCSVPGVSLWFKRHGAAHGIKQGVRCCTAGRDLVVYYFEKSTTGDQKPGNPTL
jgi:hypothetical protein